MSTLRFTRVVAFVVAIVASFNSAGATPPALSTPGDQLEETLGPRWYGSIPGKATVSASGNAVYTLPIEMPHDTHGMVPNISLHYNSNIRNGRLGLGWFMQGVDSKIVRCPRTIAQEGHYRPVSHTAEDRFCLDGNKLLSVSGSYGADNTRYSTEIDDFSRIKSYGAQGTGPAYFVVETKSGLKKYYGTTADTKIYADGTDEIRRWSLRKVEDRLGNYYYIKYHNKNAQHYPLQIDYTANDTVSPAQLPVSQVKFFYESRQDSPIRYEGGSKIYPHNNRLKHIKTYHQGLVRRYTLSYEEVTHSKQSRITRIDSCDEDGNCAGPVTLEWESDGLPTWSQWSLPVDWGNTWSCDDKVKTKYNMRKVHDFNGDGKKDFVHIVSPSNTTISGSYRSQATLDFKMRLSTPTGNYQASTWTSGATDSPRSLFWVDINSDGMVDVLSVDTRTKKVEVAISTGVGFNNQLWAGTRRAYTVTGSHHFVDMNADARPDLVVIDEYWLRDYYGNPTQLKFRIYVHTNTGKNFAAEQLWKDDLDSMPEFSDINGDHRADLFVDGKYVYLNNGSGFDSQQDWQAPPGVLTEYNGDGLPDLNAYDPVTGYYKAYLNTGNRFMEHALSSYVTNIDVDGDDLPDSYSRYFKDLFTSPYGQTTAIVKYNTGKLAQVSGNQVIAHDYDYERIYKNKTGRQFFHELSDFTGDGMPDFVVQRTRKCGRYAPGGVYQYDKWESTGKLDVFENTAAPANRLKSIATGPGSETKFLYTHLSDSNYYTKGSGAVFPVQDVQDGTMVVREIQRPNGLGGNLSERYTYEGLRRDLHGRGSLGFSKITKELMARNLTVETQYAQDFPYTHQPLSVKTFITADKNRVSESALTYGLKGAVGNGPVSPYVAQREEKKYEYAHDRLLATTTTTNVVDSYGNITTSTVDVQDHENGQTFKDKKIYTYSNDTSIWRLGQRLSEKLQQWKDGTRDTALDRETFYTYYSSNGMLKEVIREPNGVNEIHLKKKYIYNAFGDVYQEWLIGPGITDRYTQYSYDERSRQVTEITNPKGHIATQTWEHRYGVKTSQTDSNGQTTSWQYNKLGQLTLETRPDTTITEITAWKDDSGTMTNSAYYTETITTGTPTQRAFYDALGREIRTRAQGFDGRYINKDTEYNNKGQLWRFSEPYFDSDTVLWNTNTWIDVLGRVRAAVSVDTAQGFTLDVDGYEVKKIDALNRTITKNHNARGQVITVKDHVGTIMNIEYDQAGNRTKVINAVGLPLSSAVSYAYDRLGRLLEQDDPDHGVYTYTYDALGNKLTEQSPKMYIAGQHRTFAYDLLSRVTSRVEPEGTSTWTYDNNTDGNLGVGKLHKEALGDFERIYSYDSFDYGRLTKTTTKIGTEIFVEKQAYDNDGKLLSITHPASTSSPSGFVVRHQYNLLGYLERVTDSSGGTVFYQMMEADALGRAAKEWFGDGSILEQSYDGASGRVTDQHTSNGAIDIQHFSYTYDGIGNMTSRADQVHSQSETFTFDNLDRLISTQVAGVSAKSMGYNAIGNISKKSINDPYDYLNAGPHAVTSWTTSGTYSWNLNYDDNGNLAGGDWTPKITWATYNKPTQLTVGNTIKTFEYGPDRLRYRRAYSGVNKLYIGKRFERVTSGSITSYLHNIYANGRIIMYRTDDGVSRHRYVHRDHLGSVTALTLQSSGAVETRYAYDAWGGWRRATNWGAAPGWNGFAEGFRGYTGHETLGWGLIHMNGRLYKPGLGRMISPDPVTQAPEDGQNYNRYSYAYNNPLKYTDLSGYTMEEVVVVAKNLSPSGGAIDWDNYTGYKGGFTHQMDWFVLTAMERTGRRLRESFMAGFEDPTIQPIMDAIREGDSISAMAMIGDYLDHQNEAVATDRAQQMNIQHEQTESILNTDLSKENPTVTGSAHLGGKVFGGVFGASVSTGGVVDTLNTSLCSVTTACVQFGLGVFGGAGVSGGAGYSAEALRSGPADSFGIFGNIGAFGAAAGGSLNFGEGSAGWAKGFFGAGKGISAGVQFCRSSLSCIEG